MEEQNSQLTMMDEGTAEKSPVPLVHRASDGYKSSGMGGHQSTKMQKDEWLTPPEIINALGDFDLDPCSPINRPWDTAREHYTIEDNGLIKTWHGRVWLNPPYGLDIGKWLSRMVEHRNGIVFIYARTETRHFFQYVWPHAHAIMFLQGRVTFRHVDGTPAPNNGGAPSCLIAYGRVNKEILKQSGIKGHVLEMR